MQAEFTLLYTKSVHAVPTVESLIQELKNVEDWFDLGLILKVPKGRLTSFQSDDSTTGSGGPMAKMLEYWLVKNPGATWQDLIDALEKMDDQEELIARLRGYYINTPGLSFFYMLPEEVSVMLFNCYTVITGPLRQQIELLRDETKSMIQAVASELQQKMEGDLQQMPERMKRLESNIKGCPLACINKILQ